jgi:hypothetical protein
MFNYHLSPEPQFNNIILKGITLNNFKSSFGEPSEIELPDSNTNDDTLTICHYNEHQFSLFFQDNALCTVSVANTEFQIFQQNVFKLKEKQLIELFAANNFAEHEIDKDWGEKQLAFDSAGITFFFDNQKVSEVFIDIIEG